MLAAVRLVAAAAVLVLLAGPSLVAQKAPPIAVETLDEGIQRYESGDMVVALAALRGAQAGATDASRRAVASLYLAATYLQLGREDQSTASLRDALGLEPGLEIEGRGLSEDVVRRLRAASRALLAADSTEAAVRQPRRGPSPPALGMAIVGAGVLLGGHFVERGPDSVAGPHRPLIEAPPETVQRIELLGPGGIPIYLNQETISTARCPTAGKIQHLGVALRMTCRDKDYRGLAITLDGPGGQSYRSISLYSSVVWRSGATRVLEYAWSFGARKPDAGGAWTLRIQSSSPAPGTGPGILHWWRLVMDVEPD